APDGGGEVFDATIEVPITIRDPEKRIGTHIFTAMARSDAGLRWSAVTIDDGDDAKADAKSALDRITIPQDVLDPIGPTALRRSLTLISAGRPHSRANYGTECVMGLNNQPQGGLITRKGTSNPRRDDGGFSGWFGSGFQSSNTPRGGGPPDPRQNSQNYYRPQ